MISSPGTWPRNVYVCIPAFQASESLAKFLPELLAMVPATHVCVVDDGSTDATNDLCVRSGIRCSSHTENRGKGAALATGFAALLRQGADAIITMDADGQHAATDLGLFLEEYRLHPDAGICIGQRTRTMSSMPFMRIVSNTITSCILTWLCRVPISDSQCGYRLYSAALLKKLTIKYPRFEMESEVILKAAGLGFPIRFVKVQTLYFKSTSHISHVADTLRWIKAVLAIRFSPGKSGVKNP
ncbi:MAG: glycosyltransferase family 2 protein [Chitinispirillaceae bacterium]|jgi:glycosyltransferase involved in cell wall biosynthesis